MNERNRTPKPPPPPRPPLDRIIREGAIPPKPNVPIKK